MQALSIDIFSDVVCPWCYLGQKRLQLALEALAGEIEATVSWKPYQLDPTTPPEGRNTFAYLSARLGGPDAIRKSHAMLTGLGAEIGLPFALDKAKILPNTLDAHRLLHWAGQVGEEMQSRVAHALFSANFVEGANVGDPAVLVEIAARCGMDAGNVARMLADGTDRDHVASAIAKAGQMGISGVPCFVIDGKYAITGAQGVEVFVNGLRQIAASKAES